MNLSATRLQRQTAGWAWPGELNVNENIY